MPADIDIGQVLIIAIAMIAAFLQWLWKLVQERKASKERARSLPPGRSEETWSEETSPSLPPPLPMPSEPPAQPSRGGIWDLVEEFKRELRKAQGEVMPEPESASPPPLPVPAPFKPRIPKPPSPAVVAPVLAAAPAPVIIQRPKPVTAMRDDFVVLRSNLLNHDALRQAIILREILGPPKALQSPAEVI